MRSIMLAASAVSVLALSQPASADPVSEMCEFMNTLAKKGVGPTISFLESITTHWGAEQRAKLGVVIGPELDKFDYRGGQLYRTANLPGAIEEYFLTLNLTSAGSVYMRVLYEGNGGDVRLINIDFQADYYDAVSRQFLQTPEPLACSKK